MNPIKNYYAPTPAKWRKLGDALLGVSTLITGYGITQHQDTIALIALVTGVVGKFLTNFFSE